MSHQVTVEISDGAFEALEIEANAAAQPVAQVAAAALEERFLGADRRTINEAEKQAARERFERHFGSIDLGHPTGADNESIDADLGREYSNELRQA
jgi:hypothetical protein